MLAPLLDELARRDEAPGVLFEAGRGNPAGSVLSFPVY
jgi:hypothetical protein